MERAEQIMSQAATKETTSDQFDDDIDDDELCRVNRLFLVQFHRKSFLNRLVINVMKFIKHLNSHNKLIIQHN